VKPKELLAWFEEIAARKSNSSDSSSEAGARWISDAGSAIAATFPPGHQIHVQWRSAKDAGKREDAPYLAYQANMNAHKGVFTSAHDQLRTGRLESFVDSVREATEDDLLEQAQIFLEEHYHLAAAVLAGGALEVHLRRLCEKNQFLIQGHGSIDKYNQAIAQARNGGGSVVYEKADSSQVTSWGQIRNEAAHTPDQFKRTENELKLMISGIRNFISRIH